MFSTSPLKIITEPLASPDVRFAVTHRQELIAGFHQTRLTSACGVLVGAGGIGSEVGEGLCRKGLGHLRIFDHDVVEHTNLNRQHFFAPDIGLNKAECLARNLAPHCHVGTILEGYPMSFEDAVALNLDLSTAFVVCGVDNSNARVAVSRHYRSLATPVIFIAVDLLAECGHVFVQEGEPTKPCFGCAFPRSLAGRKAPCFVPSSKDILKVTAGLALYAIDSVIMERKRNWNYRRVHLAGYAPDVLINVEQNAKCPLCFSQQQGYPAVGALSNRASSGSVSPYPLVNRNKSIKIRLTDGELRQLKTRAGARGVSALLRRRALGPDRRQQQMERLTVLGEFARVRNLLNQIARNSEHQSPAAQVQILAQLMAVERQLPILRKL